MNKEWLKKKGIDKWFQRDNLIILVLSGILLFIIALPTEESGQGGTNSDTAGSGGLSFTKSLQQNVLPESSNGGKGTVENNNGSSAWSAGTNAEWEYAAYLEERLENMLSGVSGVGRVSVMITLEASEELVLEKDTPTTQSSVEEKDAEGGSRITRESQVQETTIYSTEGSNSEPYVIKRILPKVEGVLVVAEGAGSGTINKSITEIVQALFDVDAHKIKVVAMDSQ